MQFEMNGKQYDVMFQYEDVKSKHTGVLVKETHCFISWIDPDKQGRERFVRVVEGVAVQNPIDPFVKSTGRRYALGRALNSDDAVDEGICLPKQRGQIWDKYFATHKDLKK